MKINPRLSRQTMGLWSDFSPGPRPWGGNNGTQTHPDHGGKTRTGEEFRTQQAFYIYVVMIERWEIFLNTWSLVCKYFLLCISSTTLSFTLGLWSQYLLDVLVLPVSSTTSVLQEYFLPVFLRYYSVIKETIFKPKVDLNFIGFQYKRQFFLLCYIY